MQCANGRLYVVGHGAREAIEVFEVDATAATPAFTWNGCVLLPDDVLADGVAILPDWCLVVTKFLDRSLPQEEAVAQMRSEKPNGALYVAGEIWVGAFNGDCIGYVEVK